MMLILCVVFLLLQPTTRAQEGYTSALKFGDDIGSYIIFKPDMSPFRTAFSLCAWVRKLRTSDGTPAWFSYAVDNGSYNEILVSDDGNYNYIFHSYNIGLSSKFTVSPGTWHHYCRTWSEATRVHKVYLNGELVGSIETPSGRTLGMDGYVVIGNDQDSYGGGMAENNIFGGELYQLNMYSKELTASEVHDMAAGGLCSGIEEQYRDTQHLKWETILQLERTGNVKDIESGCGPTEWDLLQTRLDEMEQELNRTKGELEETREDLKGTEDRLNKTEHQLDVAALQLQEDTRQLQEAARQLENATRQLENTTRQLENATRQLENATECPEQINAGTTHWDMLYSEPFLNNVFSQDLFMQLRSSWDMLEDFVGSGVRLTEDVIEHFKSYQELRLSVSEGCDTRDGGM